jgi:pyrimidine deaminase RibD-like protein
MNYSGSPSEKPVAAGDLDRSHIGQTVSFQPNDFTVAFGTLAGIARTDGQVYLSLQSVGGGTHLKDEYDLPVGQDVYVQLDPLSSAGKTLSEAERIIREKFDEIKKTLMDREQKADSE